MASSSDWLTALLEARNDEAADIQPVGWFPDLAPSNPSFVGGLPFDRSADMSVVQREFGDASPDQTEPTSNAALVGILREALDESQAEESNSPLATPAPDPLAEAFSQGEAAGRQAAEADYHELTEHKVRLRQTVRALDQAAMDALATELAETVIHLCSQSLADYTPAPELLKKRCLEAAQGLGSQAISATLYLHPDDMLLIDKEGLSDWSIVGDPSAERGGLRFETAEGVISDRPSDWRRAIAMAIRA